MFAEATAQRLTKSLSDFVAVQLSSEVKKISCWQSRGHVPECHIVGDANVHENSLSPQQVVSIPFVPLRLLVDSNQIEPIMTQLSCKELEMWVNARDGRPAEYR